MSSYLERQQQAFASSLASAASKIQVKRPAPVSPSPSVTSTTSAAAGPTPGKKAKRDAGATIYSQPENTGVGVALGTNIVYAVDYLKKNTGDTVSLARLFSYFNWNKEPEPFQREIVERLRGHPRVAWNPDAALPEQTWRSGSYEHRPVIPHVRNKTALLAHLQRRNDAQGVTVKDLKDGWPDCEEAIAELEREHKILVVRTKKDNHARMVWSNDATLFRAVDPEFQSLWHRVEVPSLDDIVRRLAAVGQKPTSEDPRTKMVAAPKEKKQKKRVQRRGGKATNTHMEHLLKDYSHIKR